jgi:hypothetical protein
VSKPGLAEKVDAQAITIRPALEILRPSYAEASHPRHIRGIGKPTKLGQNAGTIDRHESIGFSN